MADARDRGIDIASLIGVFLALLAIVGGHLFEGGRMAQITQPTAGLIVFGGTAGACLLQYNWPKCRKAIADCRGIFNPPKQSLRAIMDTILELAKLARRQGLVAIDREAEKVSDPFLRRALRLTADGIEPKALRQALELDIALYVKEAIISSHIWEAAGGYSPTIGVLGAVMGLIHVMGHITEPDKLGAGIAIAFVATLYGVGAANLFQLPVAGKLEALVDERAKEMTLIVEGACAIAASENPLIVEQKLSAYLPESERAPEEPLGAGQPVAAA